MATLTIKQLDDGVTKRLSERAAKSGRSIEDEAREILAAAVGKAISGKELLERFREAFGAENGADLDLPKRGVGDRPPLDFSGPEYDL